MITYLIGVIIAYIIIRYYIFKENQISKKERSWEDAWINILYSTLSWVSVLAITFLVITEHINLSNIKKPKWF